MQQLNNFTLTPQPIPMAKDNKELTDGGSPLKEKEIPKADNPAQLLKESLEKLVKFGEFDLIETTLEGAKNLNPKKPALRNIFLTDAEKETERNQLKERLKLFYEMVSENDAVVQMAEKSQEKVDEAQTLLKANVKNALDATRQLEQAYRSLALFYMNTEARQVKKIAIMNASMEQVQDMDNPMFMEKVQEELEANYDRLDLRNNYSMLVIPGYMGSNKVLVPWAKLANKNKVMLITDFQNLDSAEDVLDLFESANHANSDVFLANVMMACNYLVGRGKDSEVGEEDDVLIPPSSALAGRLYASSETGLTTIAQVAAGKKYGEVMGIEGVKFPTKKTEISALDKLGIIPMVHEFGKIMAFSAKTLFNGDNLGLQTYSVVRVFDYITKVLIHFLNQRAFENFDYNTEQEIRGQIVKFLDNICGPGKLIEKFKILRFERDPNQKDRIYLDIYMVPYFPGKTFMIKLDGTKGHDIDSPEWLAEYGQSNN